MAKKLGMHFPGRKYFENDGDDSDAMFIRRNFTEFELVFATVFAREIFSNFSWNALKSPNISEVGGVKSDSHR